MRRTLPTSLAKTILLCSVLSACSAEVSEPVAETPVQTASATEVGVDKLPFNALPQVDRNAQDACPYLDTEWVSSTNGQRMTGYGTDPRFSTPACVFYSFPEEPQLTVIVREMDTVEEAIEVVDWAAPIDSTEPAEEPTGWSGGRRGSVGEGSLYAVQKDNTAVVVLSNQDQSLKAQLVTEEVITNLGL